MEHADRSRGTLPLMDARWVLVCGIAMGLAAPSLAGAQDEAPPDVPVTPTPLPAPTLPDEPELPPPAEAPPEEVEPNREVLFHLTREEDDEALPPDVAFETPGDLRTSSATQGQLPPILAGRPAPREDDDEEGDEEALTAPWTPPPFLVAAGVGWTRLLFTERPIDYVRFEQRFEARIPDFDAVKLGVGVAELYSNQADVEGGAPRERVMVEAGVRLGMGFFFCEASWVRCEGQITLQPGVIAGEPLGVQFDLHASLELRFLFANIVQASAGAAYSLVGTTSLIHVTGMFGLVF